ncbi:uncharacterized protein LOC130960214 [Arachis stenosperma]|uniref:uncharacterized protein LOC130960214 n=1 Tax=Arachis stenosperma TaxID=217475 RepID=UPI0025ABF995|nr:uncharacterized protein LOC130960214 [Arachis stenosperma]
MHQRPNHTLEEIRAKIKKHKKKPPKRPHASQEEISITQSAPPVSQGEPATPGQLTSSQPGQPTQAPPTQPSSATPAQPTQAPPTQPTPAQPAQPSARFRPKLKTFRPLGHLNPQIGHQTAATP